MTAAQRQHGVSFITVYDDQQERFSAAPQDSGRHGPALDSEIVQEAMAAGRVFSSSEGDVLYVVAPIAIGARIIGCIKLGLSLTEISNDIALIRNIVNDVMHANENRFIVVYIGIAVVTVMIGLALTLWMVRGIVHPI